MELGVHRAQLLKHTLCLLLARAVLPSVLDTQQLVVGVLPYAHFGTSMSMLPIPQGSGDPARWRLLFPCCVGTHPARPPSRRYSLTLLPAPWTIWLELAPTAVAEPPPPAVAVAAAFWSTLALLRFLLLKPPRAPARARQVTNQRQQWVVIQLDLLSCWWAP